MRAHLGIDIETGRGELIRSSFSRCIILPFDAFAKADVLCQGPGRLETEMHTERRSKAAIAVIAALATALATPALAYTGQKLRGEARIGMKEARAIAVKAHAGKITDAELEREPGGSGLRYSFDIKNGPHVQEVGVDAATGAVLENRTEGPHPD